MFPNFNTSATPGVAGYIQEIGGDSEILHVNPKGLEYNRVMNKALIGSLMTDQILNHHLSVSVLDNGSIRANNDMTILSGSSNYTAMEHHWDQAFGYVYGLDNALAPQLNQDIFLNNYLERVNSDVDFNGIAEDPYGQTKSGFACYVAALWFTPDYLGRSI